MSVNYINGNLLDSDADFICHQVNCRCKMNAGVAKAIRNKWPMVYNVYEARFYTLPPLTAPIDFMGTIQVVEISDYYTLPKRQRVVNMFAQMDYGHDGKRYTSYDSFWSCLGHIKEIAPKGSKIAFPDHIGCGFGGANWNVIRAMIEEVLGTDYEVYIIKY